MLKLASVFCDNMVLQAHKPVRVFGTGIGPVRVSFAGEEKSVTANGHWLTEFPGRGYGGPYQMTVSLNGTKVIIKNIYVGEVLLCAGQSNMSMPMSWEVTPASEYVDDDMLRLFHVDNPVIEPNYCECDGWVPCVKYGVPVWSALAYLCGRRMRKEKGCAVGMLVCAQGNTPIQTWMDETALNAAEFRDKTALMFPDYFNPECDYFNHPTYLFHTMFEHIIPYSVSACAWYQGESNANAVDAAMYSELLDALIKNWRRSLQDDTLPFVIVQIADYAPRMNEAPWPLIQQKQLEAQDTISYTKTVISRDVCGSENIHPPVKGKLAERICDAVNELTLNA